MTAREDCHRVDSGVAGASRWIEREVSGCEFKDARLGKEFRDLLEQIGGAVGETIPMACQDWHQGGVSVFLQRTCERGGHPVGSFSGHPRPLYSE